MYQGRPSHNAVLERAPFVAAWKFEAGSQINGGLAISGDSVFLDTFAGDVLALNAWDGSLRWRAHGNGNVLMSTPIVADGLVFVGSGRNGRLTKPSDVDFTYTPNEPGDPLWGRSEGDDLMAFDANDGSKVWSFKTAGEDMPSPAFLDGKLIFANGDLHTYGMDAKSGHLNWRHSTDGLATMASATVSQGRVLVSYCNDFPYRCYTAALDPATGRQFWQAPYGNSDSSPAAGGGRVFVSGVEDANSGYEHSGRAIVAALRANTGKLLWRYRSPTAGPYTAVGSSERAVAGTYAAGIYFQALPTHDELVAFDASSGRIRWRFRSTAPIKMSPVVRAGRLYVGDTAGLLYVLDANSGTVFTTRIFNEPFTTSPPVSLGNSLFIANDTTVYAIPIN